MGICNASAQLTRTDRSGEEIKYPFFAVAQYQMSNFSYAKESGSYGIGLVGTSISHWGRFHVGANLNFSINSGFVEGTDCIIDFGPSARADVTDRIFVNMPVDITVVARPDVKTAWGMRIAPSIYAFLTDRLGLFAGPQLNFGFSGGSAAFGMQAGVAYDF